MADDKDMHGNAVEGTQGLEGAATQGQGEASGPKADVGDITKKEKSVIAKEDAKTIAESDEKDDKSARLWDKIFDSATHIEHVAEMEVGKIAKATGTDPETQKKIEQLEATRKQIEANSSKAWYKKVLDAPISGKKLPIGVRVLGILCILGSLYGFYELIMNAIELGKHIGATGTEEIGLSTLVVSIVGLVDIALIDIGFILFGATLIRGRRVVAALVIYALYILLAVGALCAMMLYGFNLRTVFYVVLLLILIGVQTYLDPHLREERQLQRLLHNNEIKHEQEVGVLGRDLSGKGYIDLNFFNLFWIFVVASFLGDIMESIVHVTLVDPGHWQDRAGLLFGQFSPIYGFGALLMTIFLNRFYNKNILLIFFASAIIGGAFEYFVSWWMQYTYGAVAWDYTGQFLSIGGRTCGWAMGCWGLLGVAWIKLLLPLLLWIINKIPWKWRYSITLVATAFMAVDCVMTLEALDCWYERLAGQPVNTNIQHFYAQYFDNDWMANRFQSMTIDPHNSIRTS